MLEPITIFFLIYIRLNPSTSQFVEHLLIQRLIRFLRAHRQEDIASYKFVNDFAVCRLTFENYILFLELYHHVLYFPVNIPRL